MKTHAMTAPLLAVALLLSLSGCGKGEAEKAAAAQPESRPAAPKYDDKLDHRAFEAKSADLCVKKELALRKKEHPTSGNAGVADEALAKLCNCIAQEESKHLTKQEAKKFVEQNEYPMSLMIKAGQAEEICAKQ
jgi:hypothetical protein